MAGDDPLAEALFSLTDDGPPPSLIHKHGIWTKNGSGKNIIADRQAFAHKTAIPLVYARRDRNEPDRLPTCRCPPPSVPGANTSRAVGEHQSF